MDERMENIFPEASADGLEDEPHGELIGFGYNRFTHSMMMGGNSSSGDSLDWNRDGSIVLTASSSGGGKSMRAKYRVGPEIAQKVRDYVAQRRLAALAKKEIPTPVVSDNFTSSTISMTFDDSALGGSRCEMVTLQCGPAGMTFRTIEDEVFALLGECQESGECTFSEVKETAGGPTGFPGMMGMPEMMGIPQPGDGTARPEAAIAKPADLPEPQPGCWTCAQCGFNGNKGRFCVECGSAR